MISKLASVRNPTQLIMASDVEIMEFAVIGMPNEDPQLCAAVDEKIIRLGEGVRVYPWALIFEGATVERGAIIGERSLIGSKTTIGQHSRLVYGAQVHDRVLVGEHCVVGGFVADNSSIGSRCSVFGSLIHPYSNVNPEGWESTDEDGPILEDDVVVGWGAVIVGAIRLGKNSRVLPNAVLRTNLAPGERYGQRI